MTVKELIEHLKTLPQDAKVLAWGAYEEYEPIEAKDVRYDNKDPDYPNSVLF